MMVQPFFFDQTASPDIYALSLHDALPISAALASAAVPVILGETRALDSAVFPVGVRRIVKTRSEEHTSELQSHVNLVCRLLLEKKKPSTTTLPFPSSVAPASVCGHTSGSV